MSSNLWSQRVHEPQQPATSAIRIAASLRVSTIRPISRAFGSSTISRPRPNRLELIGFGREDRITRSAPLVNGRRLPTFVVRGASFERTQPALLDGPTGSHECLLRGESGLPASRGNASSPPVSYRSSYARFPPFRDNPRSGAKCWIKATSNRGYAFLGATCVFVNLDSSPCQDEVRG